MLGFDRPRRQLEYFSVDPLVHSFKRGIHALQRMNLDDFDSLFLESSNFSRPADIRS